VNAPAFWDDPDSALGKILSPLGALYAGATAWRLAHAKPWTASVPVICVGNLTAGGAGKTPVVRDLAARLRNPAILSRGYGGREDGPLKVDPVKHSTADVGDEPLLLAQDAACWIAADRAAGAKAAVSDGAQIIVMDDGLQNPGLVQDLRLIVVDGPTGFGNRRAIPAGPLRESIAGGIARAHALIVVGEDRHSLAQEFGGRLPVLRAKLQPHDADRLSGLRVVAFAGIGRPAKFRDTLAEAGAAIAGFHGFADHHPYRDAELQTLAAEAERLGAALATTEKDWVRLTPKWRARVQPVKVTLRWDNETAIETLLDRVVRHG
jgi:tetraacyldisaccharide 4'-kinase